MEVSRLHLRQLPNGNVDVLLFLIESSVGPPEITDGELAELLFVIYNPKDAVSKDEHKIDGAVACLCKLNFRIRQKCCGVICRRTGRPGLHLYPTTTSSKVHWVELRCLLKVVVECDTESVSHIVLRCCSKFQVTLYRSCGSRLQWGDSRPD